MTIAQEEIFGPVMSVFKIKQVNYHIDFCFGAVIRMAVKLNFCKSTHRTVEEAIKRAICNKKWTSSRHYD